MKPNTHRQLFAAVFATILAAATAAGELVTVTYRLPISIADHGFVAKQYNPVTFQNDERSLSYIGIQAQNSTPSDEPIYDSAAYLELTVEVEADGSDFWMEDTLIPGRTSQHDSTTASNPPAIVFPTWDDPYPLLFFAIDSLRLADDFHVFVAGSEVILPVTKTPAPVTLEIPDGNGGTVSTAYPIFTARAQADAVPENGTFHLVDVTAEQKAGANVTSVPSAGWGPIANLAMRSVTLVMPTAEKDNTFTFHSGNWFQSVLWNFGDVTPINPSGDTFYNVWFVGSTAGVLEKFWLTRDADLASSKKVVLLKDVEDFRLEFQPLPARKMRTVRFRVGSPYHSHVLAIVHGDGLRHPLTLKMTPDTVSQTFGGSTASTAFCWAEAQFDDTRAWSVVDENSNEVLFSTGAGYASQLDRRFAPIDLFDAGAWPPTHSYPPTGSLWFTLPFSRSTHPLVLQGALADPPEMGLYHSYPVNPNTPSGLVSYAGPWGATVNIPTFEAVAGGVNPYDYPTLTDTTIWDSTPYAGADYTDLTMWLPKASALSMQIADTRWPNQLVLRQPDGSEYPIVPLNLQGVWAPATDGSGTYTFYSYGFFAASSRYDPTLDWWVVDLTAEAANNPNATSPHQTADLRTWGAGLLDSDNDGLTNYQEFLLGTHLFNADTDGDSVNDKDDAFPFDPLHQTSGQIVANPVSAADLDGDGYLNEVDAFPHDPLHHTSTDNEYENEHTPIIVLTSPRNAALTN